MLRIDKDVWYNTDNSDNANAVINKLKDMGIAYQSESVVLGYDYVSDTYETKTQITFSCSDSDYATINVFIEEL